MAPINMAEVTSSWSRHDRQNTSRNCSTAPDMIPETHVIQELELSFYIANVTKIF